MKGCSIERRWERQEHRLAARPHLKRFPIGHDVPTCPLLKFPIPLVYLMNNLGLETAPFSAFSDGGPVT